MMKSTVHGLVKIDTAPAIVNEITLVGSRCGRFEPAIRMLSSGKVRVDNLIADSFPLDRAPQAFERAATKGVLKVLLDAS
jgi:threonine dehydrogenase-like Zn-dependent dehydrogenase